jgi:Fibronectin type III domain
MFSCHSVALSLVAGGVLLSAGVLFAEDQVSIPVNDIADVREAPIKVVAPASVRIEQKVGPVCSQPRGVLSGKIVYIGAGHGWTADDTGTWYTQRGSYNGLVEDLGNIDQLSFLAEQLYAAGATIVSFRPLGRQVNEVVIDNDDPQAEFTPNDSWQTSGSSIYYGEASDSVSYRFALSEATETAVARYTPDLPEAGFYPVYCWAYDAGNRLSDQTYRIVHTGGATEVQINHRRVGKGWVYLGQYYFDAGTGGYVEISNKSSVNVGSAVIADAIRFGNGMGDINRGSGVSGYPREDEATRYWVQSGIGQGASSSIYDLSGYSDQSDNVGTPPRMAAWMNREADGAMTDRIYLGFHTNAYDPGSLGLYNGNNDGDVASTPNQERWAYLIASELNTDMVAIGSPPLESDWPDRVALGRSLTLDRTDIEFGEIRGDRLNDEMDATIIEVAAHGNQSEARLCLDMKVRRAVARGSVQAMIRYFNEFGGDPLVFPPDTPTAVWGQSESVSSVTLGWTAPQSNGIVGDPATGYVIYQSSNGYGYCAVAEVIGGANTTVSINGLSANETTYFRVAAKNAGGESLQSEPVAVYASASRQGAVLIVNGFDRIDRHMSPSQYIPSGLGGASGGGGTTSRVHPRRINAGDYVVQHAEAIGANGFPLVSCSNEAVQNGSIDLDDYRAVFWILGEEATVDDTFNAQERSLVTSYLNQGGNFFLSGAEIGWDLDEGGVDRNFYNNMLKADYVDDDSNTYTASGSAQGIFTGLSFNFSPGDDQYDADWPDTINPVGGSVTAATYSTGGNAAIQYEGGSPVRRVVYLTFPFEVVRSESTRSEAMKRVLDFFEVGGVDSNQWVLF